MGQAHIPACAPPGHSALLVQPQQKLPRCPHAPVQPSPPLCSLFTPVIHTSSFAQTSGPRPPRRAARPPHAGSPRTAQSRTSPRPSPGPPSSGCLAASRPCAPSAALPVPAP
eukprot:315575-Prymnesium_polylepis.1